MARSGGWREQELLLRVILADLGWTLEALQEDEKEEEWVVCPYDPNHRLPACALDRHARKCCIRRTGFPPPEGPDGPSSLFYAGAPGIVQLADAPVPGIMASGGPGNHGTEFATRGNQESLRRYNEAVHRAKRIRQERPECQVPDVDLFTSQHLSTGPGADAKEDSSTSTAKSRAQLLAEERDYRRRRKKYRAKNVHLTKRSPTQKARDYINNRMDELAAIASTAQRSLRPLQRVALRPRTSLTRDTSFCATVSRTPHGGYPARGIFLFPPNGIA